MWWMYVVSSGTLKMMVCTLIDNDIENAGCKFISCLLIQNGALKDVRLSFLKTAIKPLALALISQTLQH